MSFVIQPATRQGVKPLIGIYGRSGSGKTMSALLLARGLVGEKGRIGMIDTENGRGSIFADLIPGGYSVLNLDAPFSPPRYADAIAELEKHCDVVCVDSMSHEWSGEGGILDMQEKELDRMAGDNWSKREACKMASWIKPKMEHKQMVNRLLRCKLPLICCLRGEEKTHMVKGENGKNQVVTDPFSSPLFDPRFIFEMLVTFESLNRDGKGGFVHVWKCTHPSIASLLPKENEQVSIKHGEALAAWCSAPGTVPPPNHQPDLAKLKKELWTITGEVHHKNKQALAQWLWDEAILSDTEAMEDIGADRMQEVINKVKERLK